MSQEEVAAVNHINKPKTVRDLIIDDRYYDCHSQRNVLNMWNNYLLHYHENQLFAIIRDRGEISNATDSYLLLSEMVERSLMQ